VPPGREPKRPLRRSRPSIGIRRLSTTHSSFAASAFLGRGRQCDDVHDAQAVGRAKGLRKQFGDARREGKRRVHRSEEQKSELQSLMSNSYAVFGLKKKTK